MDPLTLLRELFGEEPIRKVVTSGFDSVHKIAAITPESLCFFTGISMALARQIQASAVESLSAPSPTDYRSSMGGSAEGEAEEESAPPVREEVPSSPGTPLPDCGKVPADLMDENPLLDAGGILKTVARGSLPKEFMEDDFFDEVGLSDAETDFLEGISPWPVEVRVPEKTSSASPGARGGTVVPMPIREEAKEMEYAPVTDWSPDADPEPVPRIVRAPELDPAPTGPAEETVGAPARIPVTTGTPAQARGPEAAEATPVKPAGTVNDDDARPAGDPSLWRFGK